jgi:hypothetical protein
MHRQDAMRFLLKNVFTVAALLAGALMLSAPAMADWQSGSSQGQAWTQVRADGLTLHLACNASLGTDLYLVLSGTVPDYPGLAKVDDQSSALMIWVELPDGRTDRHPVDAHYVEADNAFVGSVQMSRAMLDRFGGGRRLYLTTPRFDEPLFVTDMRGTAVSRDAFARGCGL